MSKYELLDSGAEQKLERFGDHTLLRPCPQAVWHPTTRMEADAVFNRDDRWVMNKKLPKTWEVTHGGVKFKLQPTDFGHLGLFPEHADLWEWARPKMRGKRILNLFAYSGGFSIAAAQEGADICHLDASKGMVDWARENATLNGQMKIRWIVDDAIKFLKREIKRESFYDGIVLDPPTFGRGASGEVFKIERDIWPLLELCKALLTKKPAFLIFSCHTPGFTPIAMHHLMNQLMKGGTIETGEMTLHSEGALSIPSGSFAKWTP